MKNITEARNTTVWKAIRQINERKNCWEFFQSCSIQWHHCRQCPCHRLLEAGSLNQEKFHSVISALLFFSTQVSAKSETEWVAIRIFGLSCCRHFYVPVFSKASRHEFAQLLNKGHLPVALLAQHGVITVQLMCSVMSISAMPIQPGCVWKPFADM